MAGKLVAVLEAVARGNPSSTALTWRGSHWPYRDLLEAILRVRDRLNDAGLEQGSRVALLMRNSPHYVSLYYGIMAGGFVAVPLNVQERATVLVRQIQHSGASLVIGETAHPEWPAIREAIGDEIATAELDLAGHSGIASIAGSITAAAGDARRGTGADAAAGASELPDGLAAIIYTSGTTGRPKGVMLSHANLEANASAIIEYLKLTPHDRGLCTLPFHFSYGNSVLNSHLLSGAHLVLEDNLAYPHLTLQKIQQDRITGFAGVPSTFALLLGRCRLEDFDLESLRYITQAGGAMPRPLIDRLRVLLPEVDLFVMYGQTEATARLTYLPPERLNDKAGSVGIPVQGVEIAVRRDDQPAPPDEVGDVYARGPNVMLGYWRDPLATSEVLRDGWLKTGDLGHLDTDGFLYIDGRAVEMIKVGAFRISPIEIEEVITALSGVEEVAVTSIDDEMLGQAVKAVIVPKPGTTLDVRTVKAHCRARLAAYKIPKMVQFAAELPRTASGKVQRHKLT